MHNASNEQLEEEDYSHAHEGSCKSTALTRVKRMRGFLVAIITGGMKESGENYYYYHPNVLLS